MLTSTHFVRAAVIASSMITASASAQVLLDEHFGDSAGIAQWTLVRGELSVVDGWLRQSYSTTAGTQETGQSTYADGDETWTDYVIHTRLQGLDDGSGLDRAVLLLRVNDVVNAPVGFGPNASLYWIAVVGANDLFIPPTVYLHRSVNGFPETLEIVPLSPATSDQPNELVVYAEGPRIRVYVNGVLHINYNDILGVAGPLYGGVGVHSPLLATSMFDDFTVMALPSACPGDADGSRAVTFDDITAVLANFGTTCP
jgi:hypothetical protein